MQKKDFQIRTKDFALRVIKLVDSLPDDRSSRIFANQLGRSSCSVAANYRAACRARSKAEFIAKLGIVEEEADETLFWLEMIRDSEKMPVEKLQSLIDEADQIVRMVVSSINTSKSNAKKRPNQSL